MGGRGEVMGMEVRRDSSRLLSPSEDKEALQPARAEGAWGLPGSRRGRGT